MWERRSVGKRGRQGGMARIPRKGRGLKFESGKKSVRFDDGGRDFPVVRLLIFLVELLAVCGIAFLLVMSFGKKISIAGNAMSPALENGDVVLVNRAAYKLTGPSRGDVVAFLPEGNEEVHYSVCRVAGLPGETVQVKDGALYVDGVKMEKHVFASGIDEAGIAAEPVKLGKEEYFLLGDNAQSDVDSRQESVGAVKKDEIYGKIWYVTEGEGRTGFVKD